MKFYFKFLRQPLSVFLLLFLSSWYFIILWLHECVLLCWKLKSVATIFFFSCWEVSWYMISLINLWWNHLKSSEISVSTKVVSLMLLFLLVAQITLWIYGLVELYSWFSSAYLSFEELLSKAFEMSKTHI